MLYTKVWIVRIDNPIVEISVDSDTSGSEQLHQRGQGFGEFSWCRRKTKW